MIVLRRDQICTYQRPMVGRPRTRTPVWRVPVVGNLPYLLYLSVRLRAGQGKPFEQWLKQIRLSQQHVIAGTVARYLGRSSSDPDLIQIVLLWREQSMPPESKRTAALQALRDDLAEMVDWETACMQEGPVMLNT